MLKHILLTSTTISLCLFGYRANAQDIKNSETIIVTASRTKTPKSALPNTIEIIDSKNLSMQSQIGGSLVDSVATLIPSFSPTRQKLSGAGETLRGRSPLYLTDGVPQSSPLRDDSRDGFTIDSFFIDRVEVIFGSNAIQGVGGTGGVVNYVTIPRAKTDNWGGKFLTQISGDDSFGDSFGYKTAAFAGRKFGNLSAIFGASYEHRGAYYAGDGRRIAPDGTQGDTMDSNAYNLFSKLSYDLNDTRKIDLLYNHFEIEGLGNYVAIAGSRSLGLPASAVRGTILGETPSNKVDTAALTYNDSNLFDGNLVAQIYYNDYSGVFGGGIFTDFADPRISPNVFFDQSANNSSKFGARINYENNFDKIGLKYLLGLDYMQDKTYQELIQTNRLWVPKTIMESIAPFVQFNQKLFDSRLHISAGLRYEDTKIKTGDYETLYYYGAKKVSGGEPSFSASLGNIGATYKIADGLTTYASFAQGFTLPDVGRVLRSITKDNQDIDNFLDVSPVISNNSEIGIEYSNNIVKTSIAYFESNSDKGALLVLKGDVFEVQRQKTEISGIELNLTMQTPIDGLAFNIGATDLRGKTDTNGDGIVDSDLDGTNIAPNRVNFSFRYNKGPISAQIQNQLYQKREFVGINYDIRNNFNGYNLTDLYLGYQTKYGDLSFAVSNLFDKNYVTYNSDTRLPTNNLTFFAGRGRVISLAYSKKF